MSNVACHRATGASTLSSMAALRARSRSVLPPKAGKPGRRSVVDPFSRKQTAARRCPHCSVSATSNDRGIETNASPSTSDSGKSPDVDEEDVWALKPAWCRPPSIVATGLFAVAGADAVGGVWLAAAAAAGVAVWWWAFLVEYPAAYREYVRGTRHRGGYARSADVEEFYDSGGEGDGGWRKRAEENE